MSAVNKLIALLVRKPGRTHAEFVQYWRDAHGPLVATKPDYRLYRVRYVQSHFVQPGPIGGPTSFEGFAAVWLPETMPNEFAQTSAYRDRVRPDEESFLDVNKTLGLAVREQVVVGGTAPVKLIVFSRRDRKLDRREFCELMASSYADAVLKASVFNELLRGFRLNHVRGSAFMSGTKPSDGQVVDCMQEFWFDSKEDLDHAFLSRDYREIAATFEPSLISPASTASVIAKELTFFENDGPTPLALNSIG